MHMCCLLSFNIIFTMQEVVSDNTWLLLPRKNNNQQLLSKPEKKTKKSIDNNQYSQSLPKEIERIIKKFIWFSCWRDEIACLEHFCPITIGNKELLAIDMWRLSPENRDIALGYHGKKIFAPEDYETLKKIVPEEKKKDLVIDRLPLNDELYIDWCYIPGGHGVLNFLISPAIGISMFGLITFASYSAGQGLSFSLGIGGGLGGTIIVVGSALAYYRHHNDTRNNLVPVAFQDV